ncbi:MAG: Tetratricopeptide 2 repeat protein [Prosthecobacter sp.]|nr:Tetratricopeptide 2 repeat protein [Prosthecobacter sp.]
MSSRVSPPAKILRGFVRQQGAVMMVCALLLLLVLGIYWQAREFTFLTFDDDLFVYKNGHVLKGLTWENVRWSLTAGIGKDAQDADFWRPLSLMSHMLDVSWFGLNAGAHHLMSVALHALTAVVLFLVMRFMTGALWRSAFVAALFAVHPLHVESVAWVAERKDVLSGLFFVLALGAYRWHVLRPFRWSSCLLMLFMSALAMSSKPMLVTLPCVFLLVDLWPLHRVGTVPLKRLVLEKIPLFVMAAVVAGFTLSGHGSANDGVWAQLPWFYRAGNAILSYRIYLWQTLWPAGLSSFYPHPGAGYFDPAAPSTLNLVQVLVSLVVLLAITALVWWQRKKSCLVVAGFGFSACSCL